MSSRLEKNRAQVLERIASAARSAGRDPALVRLVAVTKDVDCGQAAEIASLGTIDLGESRTDELERKSAWLASRGIQARWHFVGHLQRNKARRVLRLADEIHSLDSAPLWETLARVAAEEQRFPGLYLQVKLHGEPAKGGLDPCEVAPLVERARGGPLPLLGLMTMAPLFLDAQQARAAARKVFGALGALAAELPSQAFRGARALLSMGMSADLEEAVQAGAHVVRVGSALFEGVEAAAAEG